MCIGPLPYWHSNDDPSRYRVIDIADRARGLQFSKEQDLPLKNFGGRSQTPHDLNRRHIVRRLSASQIKLAEQIYPKVNDGALLRGDKDIEDARLSSYWSRMDKSSFQPTR